MRHDEIFGLFEEIFFSPEESQKAQKDFFNR